jgi:hypothetical protein
MCKQNSTAHFPLSSLRLTKLSTPQNTSKGTTAYVQHGRIDIAASSLVLIYPSIFVCLFLARQPPAGQGLLIHDISSSHTTHHSRHFSGRVIRTRDLYLTAHNNHNRQTSMPLVGFEPTISAGKRPQTYALDRAATGTGNVLIITIPKSWPVWGIAPKSCGSMGPLDLGAPNEEAGFISDFVSNTFCMWILTLQYLHSQLRTVLF